MGQVTTSTEQMLKGHKEVLMFGGQEQEISRFSQVRNRMRQQGMKMVSTSSISDSIIQLIASLALAFVLYSASFPSVMETLTAGTITVIFSAMVMLLRPLKPLTNVNTQFQRGIREILLPAFAEAFTCAGFSTITFDYRGFGDSEGECGWLVPAMQIDNIISVVSRAREQSSLDVQLIGLWGSSFRGCHVFDMAARDMGIKCIKILLVMVSAI